MTMTTTSDNDALAVEEETVSTIKALKRQELRYQCQDYCVLHASPKNSKTIKEDRKLMVKWCYNVLDFFNLHRETGAIAMSYVDRYLQTPSGPEYLQDTDKYQLLCITSLYVAIKVHESPTLTPGAFVEIGRGHYSADQIVALESKLLTALQWQVNPPTALSFARHLLDLVPSMAYDRGIKATAYMLARAQTERAIGEQGLVTVAPSKIGFVAVRNALEALGYCDFPLYDSCQRFYSKAFLWQEVNELRPQLYSAINWEISKMDQVPNGRRTSNTNNTSTPTKPTEAKASRETFLENTTPRSVATSSLMAGSF